jgi:asparagine synthase (glutamine-hydrolysing)
MCGIVGFVGAGGEADLLRMTQRIEHRGPDAEGLWADPDQGIWLGHRRLSIVDLEGGDQPMWTEDGAIGVVYNGEIYNCAELRADLEKVGHVFRSDHSDTEVLLHGWREWGEELVPRLNGMWAFALHDRRTQSFFLSRDRFGQKPLFYTEYPGGIAFASELTALIAHERVEARPCSRALRKYFAYGWIPAPLSLYRGIHKLSAGCNLRFGLADRKPEVHRWWSFELEPAPPLPRGSESVWAEELQERLRRAVKRRMLSDVPLGVFLSGGIDSSAVAALAAETLPPGELRTFAVGFDEASVDESRYAEQVARAIGSRHRCRRFSLRDAAAALPESGAGRRRRRRAVRGLRPLPSASPRGCLGPLAAASYAPRGQPRGLAAADLAPEHEPGLQAEAHPQGPLLAACAVEPRVARTALPRRARGSLRGPGGRRRRVQRGHRGLGGLACGRSGGPHAAVLHASLPAG